MTTLQLAEEDLSRAATIARIKRGLESRSGKRWSVTGGTGTAYGWICIDAPPARRTWRERLRPGRSDVSGTWAENWEEYDSGQRGGHSSPQDRAELATLLGLGGMVHAQGQDIAAHHDYRREYIDRAEGRVPRVIGTPYWD